MCMCVGGWGDPFAIPQSTESLMCPLSPLQTGLSPLYQEPLAKGHFLHAGRSFPVHGMLSSSPESHSRAAPAVVLALASAGAKSSSLQSLPYERDPRPSLESSFLQRPRPVRGGSWVLCETDGFPTQELPAAGIPPGLASLSGKPIPPSDEQRLQNHILY